MQKRTFRFTDQGIKRLDLPPKPQQLDYFDTTEKGLGVRVSYGGRKSFFVLYGPASKRQRHTLGEFGKLEDGKLSLAEARRKAKEKLGGVAGGTADPAAEARAHRKAATVKVIAGDFIEAQKVKGRKSWKRQERILNVDLLPELGSIKGCDLTRADVKRALRMIADRPAPILANRAHEVIRRMLNWALLEDDYGLEANVAEKIERHAEKARERWLSPKELGAYWKAIDGEADPRKAAMLRLCLLTAQRQANVLGMHRDQLLLEDRLWLVPSSTTKTAKPYKVPLSEAAVSVIRGLLEDMEARRAEIEALKDSRPGAYAKCLLELRRLTSGYLFPNRDADGPRNAESPWHKEAHREACERATIQDYTLHDDRHTFATHCDAMGISRLIWDGILGHAGNGMADLYSGHDFAEKRLDCVERWANRISTAAAENVVELRKHA